MNLVVFDIDGTLVKHHRKRDIAFVRAVQEVMGVTIEDSWSDYLHATDSGIFSEIFEKNKGRSCTVSDIGQFKKSMVSWLEKEYGSEPFEGVVGAKECLSGLLKDGGWTPAIATGNWEFSGGYKLKSAGIDFQDIPFASADDGVKREWILQMAFSRAKKAAHANKFGKIVYVGDWIWDVKAAQALGWKFIGIAAGEVEKAIRNAGAEQVLPDFTGMTQLLNKM
jgi:phosphoglycolate phosphatase-like HAD superfamily hydrolase